LYEGFGLTETSPIVSINVPWAHKPGSVGKPLPEIELRIVGDDGKDLGKNADGELYIKGPNVMKGYYNRPDVTADAIRDGWFYTGDLGCIDAERRITITGRKKEMIVLASGKNIYPEEIEASYRQSPFIKEMCVMGLAEPGRPTSERLYAVVVPDMDLLRARKIVNAGDIIRFEMEGQAVHLPPHKRVLGYEIWFEPLPRTTTQKIKRHEVERRVRERQRSASPGADVPLAVEDRAWMESEQAAPVMAVIRARAKDGTRLFPDANLELDLGLDSMERVELLTELEQRFQTRVPQQAAHEIFTVRQLVEALAVAPKAAAIEASIQSWPVLLKDLPPDDDPLLSGLLEPRRIVAPLLFALGRMLRPLLARVRISGLENLPAGGAYIISPNHQSYLDPFLMCSALPYRVFKRFFFVGAVEYFETPLTRWFARIANLVPVDPDSNLVPAMKAGAFGLTHGKVLVLFPEGERSIDGTVKKFKKGAPILSQHLHVPIVPVAIKGVYELWPRNRGINWSLVWPWSGHHIDIVIGTPMSFDEHADYNASASQLRERVESMWRAI
jgi:long-chain acyl-CoA synthetase